jgi:uncharacterized protein YlxP (DUF503 family)
MAIGMLTIHFQLPWCHSLKEKRQVIKPMLARLHKEFNISTAEVSFHDSWQDSQIASVMVSNQPELVSASLEHILNFFQRTWPDCLIVKHRIELIP